jgi:hypothetical protein
MKNYDPYPAHPGSPSLIESAMVLVVNDEVYGSRLLPVPGQVGDRALICREAQKFLQQGRVK